MIRDPSDGSVREKPEMVIRSCTCHPDDNPPVPCAQKYALTECRGAVGSVIDTSTSGLPTTKAKAAYLERLEESRKWLENYMRPKIKDFG